MRTQQLGNTDIHVSRLCLGSMTWGHQTPQIKAFEQLDYALEHGINFIDTAEMYSVPTQPNTYGASETIIGHWLKQRGNRDKVIIASKVTGPSRIKHIRGGKARLDSVNIRAAIEGSLNRLQTDYIDVYQLHWPDRSTNFFGTLAYQHDENETATDIQETLTILSELIAEGKIRAIGISNETPWGAMTFLHHAQRYDLPRIASIQNPFNLLNRSFELGLAEVSHRENVSLLAYSPLAFGTLTGKYLNNARPAGARLTQFREFKRYLTPAAIVATQKYCLLAEQNDLTPAQLALAYVNQRAFVSSNIIGATSMRQLKEDIEADAISLTPEILTAIELIHEKHTYPAP